jgi:class 3 adenylate cyclase
MPTSSVAGTSTWAIALGESLDPEELRGLMGRYFATAREVVESHGGTVEKFIGDAVMAVFDCRSRTATTWPGPSTAPLSCATASGRSGTRRAPPIRLG